MLRPTFPIFTERLALRPFREADLDAFHDMQRRPDVVRFLYWGPRTRAEAKEMLGRHVLQVAIEREGDSLHLAADLRSTGELIGHFGLFFWSLEHHQGEIAFVVHPDHHGQGYGLEGARVMLRLGFEELGLHRIVGECDARNVASVRLMKRLGMRREAHLRENEFVKGEWVDELDFAMLDREWLASKAARHPASTQCLGRDSRPPRDTLNTGPRSGPVVAIPACALCRPASTGRRGPFFCRYL